MFCCKCGKEIPDDSAFCTYCGARVEEITEKAPHIEPEEKIPEIKETQEICNDTQKQKEKSETLQMEKVVGSSWDYYSKEFSKIEKGEKASFNKAAFLLGIILLPYRNMTDLLSKYYLLPVILNFAGIFAISYSSAAFSFAALGIGAVLNLAGSILLIVNSVKLGKNFNTLYKEHCEAILNGKSDKCGTSKGPAAGVFAGILVLMLIAQFVPSMLFPKEDIFTDDLIDEDAAGSETEGEEGILSPDGEGPFGETRFTEFYGGCYEMPETKFVLLLMTPPGNIELQDALLKSGNYVAKICTKEDYESYYYDSSNILNDDIVNNITLDFVGEYEGYITDTDKLKGELVVGIDEDGVYMVIKGNVSTPEGEFPWDYSYGIEKIADYY